MFSHHGRTLRCQRLHDFTGTTLQWLDGNGAAAIFARSGYSQDRNSRFPCGRDAVLYAAAPWQNLRVSRFSRPGSDWGVAAAEATQKCLLGLSPQLPLGIHLGLSRQTCGIAC
jgi:hypothetical protein